MRLSRVYTLTATGDNKFHQNLLATAGKEPEISCGCTWYGCAFDTHGGILCRT